MVYTEIKCDSCLIDLEPIFEEDIHIDKETNLKFYTSLQIKDALILNTEGFYGGYYDSLNDENIKIILCQKCADELLNKMVCFRKILN